jgi:hypothetical protein
MSETHILPAPQIDPHPAADSKWDRERQAFLRLRPGLLQSHGGQYVAVHEGSVVDSGTDEVALGLRVYAKYGYVPIFVGLVSDSPLRAVRVSSRREEQS